MRRSDLSDFHVIGFGLVLALLLISGVVGYLKASQLVATNRLVSHTHDVIGSLEAMLSTLKDAETGQRGYLLTEDESYLKPFEEAAAGVERDILRVRALTQGNREHQSKIEQVENSIAAKLNELRLTISRLKSGDRTGAMALVQSGIGKVTMDRLREEVTAMQEIERQLLATRSRDAAKSFSSTVWAIVVSTVLGLTATGFVMRLTQKNLRQRQATLENVSEQKERLKTTLASIGDGVITTDETGHVTNLNPVAEQLTGWRNEEAIGRPLAEIFEIVNETSRQPVSNPAERALAEGTIVGLANHTILIARDRSEHFIDDSAAPIRNLDGQVIGCVLVFRDISVRRALEKQAGEQLLQARLLAAIVESSNDAIISRALDGTIQSWNKGAQALFGFDAQQTIGKHISMLIPADRLTDEDAFLKKLRAGEAVTHFETVRRRSDGQYVDVSINLSPILDDEGNVIAASKIARDITDRKQVEERLRQLAAELSESSRRKDEFLATLAHELRNPLAPIRNGVQIIQLSGQCDGIVQETCTVIERQLSQMVRLVDDLLDVSRISRGKLEMRRHPINLADAVHLAVETSRPIIDQFSHELTVHMPNEPIIVDADLVRLGQVFANLLNNAAKYSERGGKITLTTSKQDQQVLITVKDTGIGIPTEMLEKVFEVFTQVDRSLERSQGGLGIGLTLVKRLVEMHEGTITVQSEGHGHGSQFTVSLPIVVPPAKHEPVSESLSEPQTELTSYRILVADDNLDAAKTLSLVLSFWGHQLRTAADGVEALQLAESFQPEVILLDIGMPKLNGYEVCKEIRAKPWGQTMVIIALTGWGQDEDRRLSQEAGFTHHIVKPVDTADLKKLVGRPSQPVHTPH